MFKKDDENYDPDIEYTEDESGEASKGDKIKKLKDELKQARKESQDNLDGWQRARADYANLQKSSESQMKELKEYVLGGFVEDLLPTLDSFEMAMKNREAWESVSENWRKGMEYIYEGLKGVLTNNGIEMIGNEGEKFNPEMHQGVEEIETDDETKDHTIAEVVQRGYKSSKSVIRPAKVKIYKHKA